MINVVRTIRIGGLLILAGLLAGCGMALPSTMQPVSTPTVLEEPTPTAEATAEEEWLTFADETRTLNFQYPPSWTVLAPTTADVDGLLAEAEIGLTAPFSSTLADLREILAQPEKWSAVGFSSTEAESAYLPNFTVGVVAVNALSLDLYLNLTTKQLSAVDGITVEESALVGNLRPGGMAIPSLRYTLTGALAAEDLPLKGWQVAFYDEPGDHLILFTFTAAEDQFADLSPIFARMVGSARVGNSWGIDGDLPSPMNESLSDRCLPNRWWTLPLVGADLTVHMPPDWSLADMTDPAVLSSTITSLVESGADAAMIEDVRNGAQVAVLHGELDDDASLPDFATQMTIFFIDEATMPLASYLDLFGIVPNRAEIARVSDLDRLRGDGPVQIRQFEIAGTDYAPTLLDATLQEIRYAFADPQGERAVVVAFLTSEERFVELQPTFEQIAACLSFNSTN
jgi:hypothetical protein